MSDNRNALGDEVPLCEAPTGIFRTRDGNYGFKTEYRRDDKSIDAYCLNSGEAWWGEPPQSVESQRAQLVTPVDFDALRARLATAEQERDAMKIVATNANEALGALLDVSQQVALERDAANRRVAEVEKCVASIIPPPDDGEWDDEWDDEYAMVLIDLLMRLRAALGGAA